MTKFFEPINVSAAHIYHSALELSPEFSTVRMLYYDRRPTPFPRVAAGIADSWDSSIDIPRPPPRYPPDDFIWSLCSRFVATRVRRAVEIRDSLTVELLSILEPSGPTPQLIGTPAYSPDGCSIACASDTGIIIWDIQTGGVAKEILAEEIKNASARYPLVVWSLDGRSICAMNLDSSIYFTVRRFDVVSGTEQSSIRSHSRFKPHLWAHDKSFRVMMWAKPGQGDCTIDIFEVEPTLTKIESFAVQLGGNDSDIGLEAAWWITSFSPTTYRISVSIHSQDRLLVLDIRNSGTLLDETQIFDSHCFSPDGGFFAASRSQDRTIQIWKYDGSSYVAWRNLPTPTGPCSSLSFSPTSSSFLAIFDDILKVWHLDDLSLPPIPYSKQFGIFSRSGAYLVTTSNRGNTITITDVLSRTPLQLIHTGIEMPGVRLAGNVLLAVGLEVVVAWLLTEEGLVNGVFGNRVADPGDSIWTAPVLRDSSFSAKGETAVIRSDGVRPHVYNTRTGETLELYQTAPDWSSWRRYYLLGDVTQAQSHLYYDSIGDALIISDWNTLQSMKKGWVKDRGVTRHLLWLPVEWRGAGSDEVKWLSDVAIIELKVSFFEIVAIKLY